MNQEYGKELLPFGGFFCVIYRRMHAGGVMVDCPRLSAGLLIKEDPHVHRRRGFTLTVRRQGSRSYIYMVGHERFLTGFLTKFTAGEGFHATPTRFVVHRQISVHGVPSF